MRYRFPTCLRHFFPDGWREIEAATDVAALEFAQASGADVQMNNMQIFVHRWHFVVEWRAWISETQVMISENGA